MNVVNSDAVTKNLQVSFSSINWEYKGPINYFEFNFTIKTVNPLTRNFGYTHFAFPPLYSVEIYYVGNYL